MIALQKCQKWLFVFWAYVEEKNQYNQMIICVLIFFNSQKLISVFASKVHYQLFITDKYIPFSILLLLALHIPLTHTAVGYYHETRGPYLVFRSCFCVPELEGCESVVVCIIICHSLFDNATAWCQMKDFNATHSGLNFKNENYIHQIIIKVNVRNLPQTHLLFKGWDSNNLVSRQASY